MNVLAVNAGGSSLKLCLYVIDRPLPITEPQPAVASAEIERTDGSHSKLVLRKGGETRELAVDAGHIEQAAARAARALIEFASDSGAPPDVHAAGIRVVHGGADFIDPMIVDDRVLQALHALIPLAPLHLPSDIAAIEAVRAALPNAQCAAVFDTAFHHDLPPEAALYGIPRDLSVRYHLRRYGFHGISYRFVLERTLAALGRPADGLRLILCHLGGGASICAIRDGRSIDTSMGLTPLEGLLMGTRCGDIDAGLVLYLQRALAMSPDALEDLLNHQSGLLGLSGGVSSDTRDLQASSEPDAEEALNAFCYRARKYNGAYAAALGGVDGLVFTDKIGVHGAQIRERICAGLGFLGLDVDRQRNRDADDGEPHPIGTGDGSLVWVVPNDEERQIALETYRLLRGQGDNR